MVGIKTLSKGKVAACSILATTLLSANVFAAEISQESKASIGGFTLDVGYEDGAFFPKGKLPYYWNQNFSSYISATGKQTLVIENLFEEDDDSLNASILQENRFAISPLTYEDSSGNLAYSLGVELEKLKIKATDRGFYLNEKSASWHFNLDRKIDVLRLNIPLSVQYRTQMFTNRLNISVTPKSDLELSQSIFAPELNTTTQQLDEKEAQDIAWSASWEGVIRVPKVPYLVPGWHLGYEYLPLKYKGLSATDLDTNPSGFEIAQFQNDTSTLRAEFRLYTPSQNKQKSTRYISIAREKITIDSFFNERKEEQISTYRTVYSIGFDERF